MKSWTRRYRRYRQQHMHAKPGTFFVVDSLIVLIKLLTLAVGVFVAYRLAMML
jgi:hypothetical protein